MPIGQMVNNRTHTSHSFNIKNTLTDLLLIKPFRYYTIGDNFFSAGQISFKEQNVFKH